MSTLAANLVSALCGHLGIQLVLLKPGRPECKGQAERTVGCLNRSFLPLRTFTDLDDLHVQHDAYRGGGLGRYHRRVGARCFGRRPRR